MFVTLIIYVATPSASSIISRWNMLRIWTWPNFAQRNCRRRCVQLRSFLPNNLPRKKITRFRHSSPVHPHFIRKRKSASMRNILRHQLSTRKRLSVPWWTQSFWMVFVGMLGSSSPGSFTLFHFLTVLDATTNIHGQYELISVLTHVGRSADAGHYMAWCRKDEAGRFPNLHIHTCTL